MKGIMKILGSKRENDKSKLKDEIEAFMGWKKLRYIKQAHNCFEAVIIDKPVYRIGETAKVLLYFYDQFTKRPVYEESKYQSLFTPKLKIVDANNVVVSEINYVKSDPDNSVTTYYFPITAFQVVIKHF